MENFGTDEWHCAIVSIMDRLLQARVNGQGGLVTRAQALAGGLTRRAIDWKVHAASGCASIPGSI